MGSVDIDSLRARISQLNNESASLNKQRQINIGKSETLKKQFADLAAKYEASYGVKITSREELDKELETVCYNKQAEATYIETMLGLIREGKYTEAENFAKGEQGEQGEQVEKQPEPVQDSAPDGSVDLSGVVKQEELGQEPVQKQEQESKPFQSIVGASKQIQPIQPPEPAMSVPPVMQTVESTIMQTQKQAVSQVDAEPVPSAPTPVAPPPVAKPKLSGLEVGAAPPVQNSFAAILGGTAFDPNQ